MDLITNVKTFRCRVSSTLRIFKDLNIGKEGAEKGWNLMHRMISSGVVIMSEETTVGTEGACDTVV